MKFAKELDQDAVPEWKAKYFNYKQGKKKIKAVANAYRNANRPLRTPTLRNKPSEASAIRNRGTRPSPFSQDSLNALFKEPESVSDLARRGSQSAPIDIPNSNPQESIVRKNGQVWTRYGSIIGTPPETLARPPTLELPSPAIEEEGHENGSAQEDESQWRDEESEHRPAMPQPSKPALRSAQTAGSAFEVGQTKHPSGRHVKGRSRGHSTSHVPHDKPLLRRIFTRHYTSSPHSTPDDVPLEALKEVDRRKEDFYDFLKKELDKIEYFYKSREDESSQRLQQLREQLHALRDQRQRLHQQEQIKKQRAASTTRKRKEKGISSDDTSPKDDEPRLNLNAITHPINSVKTVRFRKDQIKKENLATPPSHAHGPQRDYTRKSETPQVKYSHAKRRLKRALREYYRGLELLKSYALVNRTAFRKINKKYDKTVRAKPTMKFVTDYVNTAHFVQSNVLDGLLQDVEDLYSRYFEDGNRKIAVAALKKKFKPEGAFNSVVFRNGLTLAAAVVLALQGIVKAAGVLVQNRDAVILEQTSYLLQLYAGYFLMLLLMLCFCFDCKVFNEAKINYTFIFEFDTHHNIDWRQLSEIPCFLFFLLSLIFWLNFIVDSQGLFLYWPVILVGITLCILFLPAPILYYRSRRWFLISCARLLGVPFTAVNFRDFFLGDMFCSLTYGLGNVELFFCLYSSEWKNPPQCNSTHSRLLGFFQTLPGIVRALQCLRRFYDTRNPWPQLVNCGKYVCTILYYATLSMYRVDPSRTTLALFVTFATINAVYCSVWDIFMDWSLGAFPPTPHPFLRPRLGYPKHTYAYFFSAILDVTLRFNWIFYSIYTHNTQHSSLVSFFVGFSEVIRRGIWVLFRVENEHCNNVGSLLASKNVRLPYDLSYTRKNRQGTERSSMDGGSDEAEPALRKLNGDADAGADAYRGSAGDESTDVENAAAATEAPSRTPETPALRSLRRRHTPQQAQQSPPSDGMSTGLGILRGAASLASLSRRSRVGTLVRTAHQADFERKKGAGEDDGDSDDDDDESDKDGGQGDRDRGSEDEDLDDDEEGEREEEVAQVDARAEGFLGQGGGPAEGSSSGARR